MVTKTRKHGTSQLIVKTGQGGNAPFVQDSFETININEPYLEWVEYILALNNSDIPQVISTSCESLLINITNPLSSGKRAASKLMRRSFISLAVSDGDDEQTVPLSYAKKVCRAFAQLGARGVSVIFSSGDFGVGPSGYCKSNDGKVSGRAMALE